MTPKDVTLARNFISNDPFVRGDERYVEELEEMVRTGEKMELEAMAWKGVNFLAEEWLGGRIRATDYL